MSDDQTSRKTPIWFEIASWLTSLCALGLAGDLLILTPEFSVTKSIIYLCVALLTMTLAVTLQGKLILPPKTTADVATLFGIASSIILFIVIAAHLV